MACAAWARPVAAHASLVQIRPDCQHEGLCRMAATAAVQCLCMLDPKLDLTLLNPAAAS